MKLNLENIVDILKTMREYLFPLKKITNKFKSINSKEDLQNFVQERSAHVTQTTLYGYIKTRIGARYALMFEDEVFSIISDSLYVSNFAPFSFKDFSFFKDYLNF